MDVGSPAGLQQEPATEAPKARTESPSSPGGKGGCKCLWEGLARSGTPKGTASSVLAGGAGGPSRAC
eukprot:13117694-Alexandrium_andersonii.AAC.1